MQSKGFKLQPARRDEVSGVHLWLILLKAFHAVEACSARRLRASGLGDSDFRILELLLHKGPMQVNTIGPRVFLTQGSVSIAVNRLHTRSLVSRTDHPVDRRIRVIDLTDNGRTLIERVFSEHAKDLEELAGILTPSERGNLAEGLKKFGKHAEDCLLARGKSVG